MNCWPCMPPICPNLPNRLNSQITTGRHISGFIQLAVGGQPSPALTMEIIHGFNAEQAARYAGAGRAGALELLRQNGAATAAQ